MIQIRSKSIIYVLCPSFNKTGGTELAHQLVFEINRIHGLAKIAYYENQPNPMTINEAFERYVNSFVRLNEIIDSPTNILIAPEICTNYLKSFKSIQKCIWWMSVDNYMKRYNAKVSYQYNGLWAVIKSLIKRRVSFGYPSFDQSITHFYQSEYAKKFLEKCGVSNAFRLSDYLNSSFLNLDTNTQRKDQVLYNPRKGFKFTQKLMEAAPDIKWIPLQNMTTEQVKDTLLQSKVYIDFGNHPGKDRFPREAAMCGCCVITGKRGSANYFEDIPIADEYKFGETKESIPLIIAKIRKCINNYDAESQNFNVYKDFIKNEYQTFQSDVKDIFSIKGSK